MADAANDGLSYPATFNEFLALMERWHRARDGVPSQGEHPLEALRRTAHELTDVTAMARQVWANAEAGRTAGVAMPWKPPPYPATPTEREALAKRRAALGVVVAPEAKLGPRAAAGQPPLEWDDQLGRAIAAGVVGAVRQGLPENTPKSLTSADGVSASEPTSPAVQKAVTRFWRKRMELLLSDYRHALQSRDTKKAGEAYDALLALADGVTASQDQAIGADTPMGKPE